MWGKLNEPSLIRAETLASHPNSEELDYEWHLPNWKLGKSEIPARINGAGAAEAPDGDGVGRFTSSGPTQAGKPCLMHASKAR